MTYGDLVCSVTHDRRLPASSGRIVPLLPLVHQLFNGGTPASFYVAHAKRTEQRRDSDAREQRPQPELEPAAA